MPPKNKKARASSSKDESDTSDIDSTQSGKGLRLSTLTRTYVNAQLLKMGRNDVSVNMKIADDIHDFVTSKCEPVSITVGKKTETKSIGKWSKANDESIGRIKQVLQMKVGELWSEIVPKFLSFAMTTSTSQANQYASVPKELQTKMIPGGSEEEFRAISKNYAAIRNEAHRNETPVKVKEEQVQKEKAKKYQQLTAQLNSQPEFEDVENYADDDDGEYDDEYEDEEAIPIVVGKRKRSSGKARVPGAPTFDDEEPILHGFESIPRTQESIPSAQEPIFIDKSKAKIPSFDDEESIPHGYESIPSAPKPVPKVTASIPKRAEPKELKTYIEVLTRKEVLGMMTAAANADKFNVDTPRVKIVLFKLNSILDEVKAYNSMLAPLVEKLTKIKETIAATAVEKKQKLEQERIEKEKAEETQMEQALDSFMS